MPRIAGKPLEPLIPKCNNSKDWVISSQASKEEGSTTSPEGRSLVQTMAKWGTPATDNAVGEDIVYSPNKYRETEGMKD